MEHSRNVSTKLEAWHSRGWDVWPGSPACAGGDWGRRGATPPHGRADMRQFSWCEAASAVCRHKEHREEAWFEWKRWPVEAYPVEAPGLGTTGGTTAAVTSRRVAASCRSPWGCVIRAAPPARPRTGHTTAGPGRPRWTRLTGSQSRRLRKLGAGCHLARRRWQGGPSGLHGKRTQREHGVQRYVCRREAV